MGHPGRLKHASYALNELLTLNGEYGYRESEQGADRSRWDIGANASFDQFAFDLRY